MDFGISGKTALVLGSSQGLGFDCARALHGEGANIVLNSRTPDKLAMAAKNLGETVGHVAGNVSNAEDRARIFREAREFFGPVSILVTNASGPPPGPMEAHDHDAWLGALETNMLSAIGFVKLVLPDMVAGGFGRIVNITSFSVREPYPNMGLATGVRAGLTGAMSAFAREVADTGVTVNNLLPGLMDTPALQRVFAARAKQFDISEAEAQARMAASVPMQRLGEAVDFGPACAFLCSRQASYITAQNITVDGGLVGALL